LAGILREPVSMPMETLSTIKEGNRVVRSVVLVAATALVLGGAFFAYWRMQSPNATRQGSMLADSPVPPLVRRDGDKLQTYGPGTGIVLQQYRKDNGGLSSILRCDDYTTHKDGTIGVVNPSCECYLS